MAQTTGPDSPEDIDLVKRYQALKKVRVCVQKERDDTLDRLDIVRNGVFQAIASLGDNHRVSVILMETLNDARLLGE